MNRYYNSQAVYMAGRLENDDRLAKEYKFIKKEFGGNKGTKLSISERKSGLLGQGLRMPKELF